VWLISCRNGEGRVEGSWRPFSGVRGYDIEQDCHIVRGAAGEDEDMPGGVEVAEAVEGEKDNAECVGEAAHGKPEKSVGADCMEQGTGSKSYKPALQEIDKG
jgi:hypothetical protein